jgi:hypothetical protein
LVRYAMQHGFQGDWSGLLSSFFPCLF